MTLIASLLNPDARLGIVLEIFMAKPRRLPDLKVAKRCMFSDSTGNFVARKNSSASRRNILDFARDHW